MATFSAKSKFFSWGSKNARQSTSPEPYYRTGGLLPIDTSVGIDSQLLVLDDAKDTTWHRNPKNLSIVPPNYITAQSPGSAHQNDALVQSAPNLLAAFSDSVFSPSGFSPTACIKLSDKSLPAPLSKYSLRSSPSLPAELPGSILLENQGFPATPPPDDESIPNSAVTSVRSMYSLARSDSVKVPRHRKSANDINSRPSLIASPSSTDSNITTCSTVSNDNANRSNSTKARVGPDVIVEGKQWQSSGDGTGRQDILTSNRHTSTAQSKQLDELKATITAQDHTISTLQSQFASLRVSHDAHVSSLVNAHSLEVSALKDYAKSLESQQKGLHHASSNHLLFMLDTTDPQSPRSSMGSTRANSIRSAKPSHENSRSPLRTRNNPEMELLKRKLSTAKRPETGNGDAVRELSLYKQNNEALQKQVESLMAKLNQSEEEARKQKRALQDIQKACDEWREKASKAEQLEKSAMALQNTIDHLEHRLEIANVDKVDAQERLLNIQSHTTPFDPKSPKPHVPDNRQSTRTSISTVFANESPINQGDHESTALAAFVSHIERLEEYIRQKDAQISELEVENDQLRQKHGRLQGEHRDLDLQTDIQDQLLTRAKQNEIHIEELRTAIIKREAMIGEKSRALQQAERQLEHHRLLLEAEIRRHATFTLLSDAKGDPLPELTSLASKDDIDRWIARLRKQLNKDKAERKSQKVEEENALEALRRENDFYIREIIYYKLDCRGYKSDIKKLKRIAAQMGRHDSRPDEADSPDPSAGKSVETPAPTKLSSVTSNPGASTSSSSIFPAPISLTIPLAKRMTPPPSELTPDPSPIDKVKRTIKRVPVPLEFNLPMTPRTPALLADANLASEADKVDPGISPRSVVRLSPERRKPTPSSPDQEKFGELATNFPLSTPAAPKRHGRRSMSDSMIHFSSRSTIISDSSSKFDQDRSEMGIIPIGTRDRSGSVPEPPRGKITPERPPRPRFGLFDTDLNDSAPLRLQAPPRVNVMAEAMRNSPDRVTAVRPTVERRPFNLSAVATNPLSTAGQTHSCSSTAKSMIPAQGSMSSRPMHALESSAPSRRPSTASSSNVPFVIAMGSPHNPALITPTPSIAPTACSITAKRNVAAPALWTGVGGTMASTTPVTSPISLTDASKKSYFGNALPSCSKPHHTPDPKVASAHPTRTASLSSSFAAPTAASRSRTITSGHARNLSTSSIRQAINLPARMDFMKGKGRGKEKKDNIGYPTPLASPFDMERETKHSTVRADGKAA